MARTVTRIARAKASWPSVASRPAEVGQQRGLDRLEELQRGARDEQRVEDDAGEGRRRRGADREHRGVEQRLLGELDRRDREGEAGARAQRERALVGGRRRVVAPSGARIAQRDDEQRGERRRQRCPAPRPTARWRGRPRPRPGSRSATPTRTARGRRRGRTTGGRRGSRGRSSWPRRPASRRRRPSTASSRSKASSIGPRSARATTRKATREAGLDEQRDPQRVPAVMRRARGGRRSSATAAARPGGRSPR